MFLRSKYKENRNVVKADSFDNIGTDDFKEPEAMYYAIQFRKDGCHLNNWLYPSKEERDTEYEWVLSQLDCRVNGETKEITELKTKWPE